MSEHSFLPPSGAITWARCPGAPHLTRDIADPEREYSASGSVSHSMLEECLKHGTDPADFLGKTLKQGSFEFVVDKDRVARVRSAITAVSREPGTMWVEKLLRTSPILGVPDQIGHADIIKADPDGAIDVGGTLMHGVLSVHDYKDGWIRVNAKDNLQGLLYLAAAMYEFDLMAPFMGFRFCIHQPSINHYDEWAYSRAEMEAFIGAIRGPARLAYEIYSGIVPFDPEKHLIAGEEQCFWCRARGRCPARARRIIGMFGAMKNTPAIDDARLGALYAQLDEIERACSDYRGEALRRALAGRTIEGYKLVRGRRGARAWTDAEKAEGALSLLLSPKQIYEPKVVISPTEAEDMLSKDEYQALKSLITQRPGAYTLAPITDKRDAVEPLQFPVVSGTPEQANASLI